MRENEKSRGVYCKVPILKNNVIDRVKTREKIYALNKEGCFLMDFISQGKDWLRPPGSTNHFKTSKSFLMSKY